MTCAGVRLPNCCWWSVTGMIRTIDGMPAAYRASALPLSEPVYKVANRLSIRVQEVKCSMASEVLGLCS